MNRWLLCLCLLLPVPVSAAVIPCPLDTTNPAVTHVSLPIHGGGFQGVAAYSGPDQWVYHSKQGHLACAGCTAMTFDDSAGLLNPATVHIHLEWCSPDGAEVTGPFTIPARMRAYHAPKTYRFDSGPMTQNVVFTPAQDVPWHDFPGDAMGVAVTTFTFTFNPFVGDSGPNIHAATPNGWTNFTATATATFPNGNSVSTSAMVPVFTRLDKSTISASDLLSWQRASGVDLSGDVPENTEFYGAIRAGTGITSVADGGSGPWGSQIVEVKSIGVPLPLPLLAPFNSIWPFDFNGYMYGGQIGFDGTCEMHVDMDLHNGVLGKVIPGLPALCTGIGHLDPAAIGTGVHTITFVWEAKTGPTGVPITRYDANGQPSQGMSAPNENAWALEGFTVQVGTVAPTPLSIGPFTDKTVMSPDGKPMAVTYVLPTAFGGAPPVTVVCTPASGTVFAIGATSVRCVALDSLGATAFTLGTITVTAAAPTPWTPGTVFSRPSGTGTTLQFELCPGTDPTSTQCQPK